eukprot:m.296597 g.296597  ORF g.296597 m.296597 type:complete len:449 (+) comp20067_c0_seq2:490-1836(+)
MDSQFCYESSDGYTATAPYRFINIRRKYSIAGNVCKSAPNFVSCAKWGGGMCVYGVVFHCQDRPCQPFDWLFGGYPGPLLCALLWIACIELQQLLSPRASKQLEAPIGATQLANNAVLIGPFLIAATAVTLLQVDVGGQGVFPRVQAQVFVRSNLIQYRQHKGLVAALSVAIEHASHAPRPLSHFIQALRVGAVVPQGSHALYVCRVWDEHVWQQRVEIPFERFALQTLSQRFPLGHIAKVRQRVLCAGLVKVFLVVVHPHFCHACRVLDERIMDTRSRHRVRMGVAEDVAHVGARSAHKSPAAHPDAEGNLQIFAAPAIHFFIVRANLCKVVLVDAEEAPRHCGRVDWIGGRIARFNDASFPREIHCPRKRSHCGHMAGPLCMLHGLGVDRVNDRCHHCVRILANHIENGFRPLQIAFAMAVEKRIHRAFCVLRSKQACADQTKPLG